MRKHDIAAGARPETMQSSGNDARDESAKGGPGTLVFMLASDHDNPNHEIRNWRSQPLSFVRGARDEGVVRWPGVCGQRKADPLEVPRGSAARFRGPLARHHRRIKTGSGTRTRTVKASSRDT